MMPLLKPGEVAPGEWAVNKVTAARIHKGSVEVLVKWHKWEEKTWEPLGAIGPTTPAVRSHARDRVKARKLTLAGSPANDYVKCTKLRLHLTMCSGESGTAAPNCGPPDGEALGSRNRWRLASNKWHRHQIVAA
jgi:hypothetical protein